MAKDRADTSAQHAIYRMTCVSRTNRKMHTKFGLPKDNGDRSQPPSAFIFERAHAQGSAATSHMDAGRSGGTRRR